VTDISFLGSTPLQRLINLMTKLRSDSGCAWDKEQTFKTIAPYTIEEAYEVREAINANDMDALKEELGDLMFQVVFHSQMAWEVGAFDLNEVCDKLTEKMVRRHPHVFGPSDNRSAEEQTVAWETLKAQERKNKNGQNGILDDVALALPALMRADKLQKRAARVGFDWPDLEGVTEKISEEAMELAEAAQNGSADDVEDEVGDLLFAVANLARKLKVDPEKALRRTNDKFTQRFRSIETYAQNEDRSLDEMTLAEMETQWQAAKRKAQT